MADERNGKLEDRSIETFQTRIQKEKRTEKIETFKHSFWVENHKRGKMCITGIPEGEERMEQKKYLNY